jgi:hypothetical protein
MALIDMQKTETPTVKEVKQEMSVGLEPNYAS